MRVLLLNPPGRTTYIRDYFCSKTTKSNYLYQPIDLVVLSGVLAERHEVSVVDAVAERLSPDQTALRIAEQRPDVVVSLVGAVSWDEDRSFLAELAATDLRILVIGDVLQENSVGRLEAEPWIEAALHVFANQDVLHYLDGDWASIEDMTVREEGGTPLRLQRVQPEKRKGTFRIPRPRHELFPAKGYHFSFARAARFATVLTDYGCPYPCTFCVIGTLGFQTRPVADVLEEIDDLRSRGVHEFFFLDQTFGLKKERAAELCEAFAARGDLSWTAFTRPDTATDELLANMKAGGCHTVILGAESADDDLLKDYEKGYASDAVREAFRRAKNHGLRTVGTFVVGLPEQDEDALEKSLLFALELELDFLSLNVAVPRFGTPFREKALEMGLCSPDDLVMDQAGADAFLPTKTLDREALVKLKRRMVRRFYLRPAYLWQRLRSIRNLYELRAQAREGAALLLRNV